MSFKKLWEIVQIIVIICVALLGILNCIQWSVSAKNVAASKHAAFRGRPNIFVEMEDYNSQLSPPVIDGEQIYILYSQQCLIQVYSLEGQYQYSIIFSDDSPNGSRNIYAKDGELYFENGTTGGIYVFHHGQFVTHVTGQEAQALHQKLMDRSTLYWNNIDSKGNTYVLRGSSVIRITPDGEENVVIHRAAWKAIFQSPSILTYSFVLMLLLLFLAVCKKH